MKNSHLFLSLVSLSLTVISARAASLETNTPCVQLPVFTVEAPRLTAAERQIARNLDELRAAARTPIAIETEIPLLGAKNTVAHETTNPARILVVARS
jgi:hypothetical protein